ncbi:MAG TPA: DUF1045 domain-containing protein [Ktedonosporobacter sp.]|nr:DUF1045 domain-containing protein [Ktedonosporobacter sp.]
MPKFAVYYIPPAIDPCYQLGTQILGYDVRTQRSVEMPPDLQEYFGQFHTGWTAESQPFGFHLTISDALDCNWATIPLVERELGDLLACFQPTTLFTLQRRDDHAVGIWGKPGRHTLVLLYEPNEYLRMLHTLITARINPLANGSGYLQRYLSHPERELPAHKVQQLRLFYSPTVLDNWYPHFTLLNPYTEEDVAEMAARLAQRFEPYKQFTLHSVCLLVQRDEEARWQIYREFHRP